MIKFISHIGILKTIFFPQTTNYNKREMLTTTKRYSPEAIRGILVLSLSSVLFLYLTAWLLFLPFIDDDHHVRKFFFPGGTNRQLVANVLTRIGGAMIGLCGATIGVAMVRKKER